MTARRASIHKRKLGYKDKLLNGFSLTVLRLMLSQYHHQMASSDRIQQLIEKYKLKPHPEGGYFSEEYRASTDLFSPRVNKTRSAITHIYFLLAKGEVSRWHKVLHDEIWNFYEGDPLTILEFDGNEVEKSVIGGKNIDLAPKYFKVIQAAHYQAAESIGEYSFVGCSVAPGFDFEDFSLIDDPKLSAKISSINDEFIKFI